MGGLVASLEIWFDKSIFLLTQELQVMLNLIFNLCLIVFNTINDFIYLKNNRTISLLSSEIAQRSSLQMKKKLLIFQEKLS